MSDNTTASPATSTLESPMPATVTTKAELARPHEHWTAFALNHSLELTLWHLDRARKEIALAEAREVALRSEVNRRAQRIAP